MSTYSAKTLKNFFCRLFFPGFMAILLFVTNAAVVAQETQFKRLQDRYLSLVTTMGRNLKKPSNVLPRFVPGVDENIEIDENFFKSLLSTVLSAKNVTISDECFPNHELESRDNVPFRIEGGKVIISKRIADAPESQFFFYMTFMKIYSGLNPDLLENPNVISIGICALIAQEFTYRSTLAVLPRFFDETALANLLYCYDKDLIQLPFDKGFYLPAFKNRVENALQTFLHVRSDDTEFLFSENKKFKIRSLLCNLKPGLLQPFCTKVDEQIHHLTIRFMIYNALFKCFEKDVSRMRRSRDLMDAFREELRIRYGKIPSRLDDLRFEKNTFSSLYQYIYNGSDVIAGRLKAAGLETLDLDNRENIKKQKENILDIINREEQIKPLLQLMALPTIELGKKEDNTGVLGFQWWIDRTTTTARRDSEFINVEFERRPVPKRRKVIVLKNIKEPAPVKKNNKKIVKTGKKGKLGNQGEIKKGKKKGKKKGGKRNGTVKKKPCIKKKSKPQKKRAVPPPNSKGNKGNRGGKKKTDLTKVTFKQSPVKRTIPNKPKRQPEIPLQVLTKHTKLPRRWKKREIRLDSGDLHAIKKHQAVAGLPFNLTNDSFSRLHKMKKKELELFIGHFVKLDDGLKDQLRRGNLLSQLTRGFVESYVKQKEEFLKFHDIRILRHMIQKFVFLSYISYLFGHESNVKILNQDILEISLRTILFRDDADYEGYRYFADLQNSLLYVLKYIQDMKYFHDNDGPDSTSYADVTVGISQKLSHFVKERLTAINLLIGDKPGKIAIAEVVGEKKINLRNMVSQLDKLKDIVKPGYLKSGEQRMFQKICGCSTYNSQLYDCLFFADDHVITATRDKKDAFGDCFKRYFSLQDTRMSLE